jgi:hypothetical protein
MKAMTVIDDLRAQLAAMITYKITDYAVDITLPYSTLSSKFVAVFVQGIGDEGAPEWIVSDGGYLYSGEYEVPASSQFHVAALAVGIGFHEEVSEFRTVVTDRKMLTSAVFDMAQFIQLAANLSYLEADND